MRDYADEQVKGIFRFLPTPLSRILFTSAIPSGILVFTTLLAYPGLLGVDEGTQAHTAMAVAGAFMTIALLLAILVIDLGIELHYAKHRRINHTSNEHPLMAWRFLAQNAESKHWIALLLFAVFWFGFGFFIGSST